MSPAADAPAARLRVIAVVVSHDGVAWLPHLLSALTASTRAPDVLLGVDTGSVDGSAGLLRVALGPDNVVETGRRTGFGAAVAQALATEPGVAASEGRHAAQPPEEWVWLLHDDCAPAPDALASLVEVARSGPDIAVVGCRVRAWPDGRRLLEAGVSISGTGRRETGLEPDEQDQGQYDEQRDVLAVSSAGMLVRRAVWDTLGGFDPRLPLFRDDVDLGWRVAAAGHRVVVAPRAVLFHVEAAAAGVRDISATTRRPRQADRSAALYTLLVNCRPRALAFRYARCWLGSLLRAVGFLLAKRPGAAWDEVAAAASVLCRPWRLRSGRAWRRARRGSEAAPVRPLLPPWWSPYARALDLTLSRLAETVRESAGSVTASARRLRARGGGDPADRETGPVAALLRHPLLVLVVTLAVAGLVASRGLWGTGFLHGGALLPAPDGAGDWWTLYAEEHHQVGLGSGVATAPYVGLLLLPATLLLGKAWLLVDLIMLCSAPAAAFGAWFCSGRLVRSVATRAWMAATYGLVPVLTGAETSGHLGTVVLAVLLPWLGRSAYGLLATGSEPRWGAAWATGLLLSVSTAFAPVCWPIAASVGVVAIGWLASGRHLLRIGQWLVALATPLVVLAPWSGRVLAHPGLLLTEAGAVDVPGASLSGSGWQLAFGRVGAAGQAPWWLGIGLTFVALAALARRDTRARVTGAWAVTAAGLSAAAVMWHQPVDLPLGAGQAYAWLGVPIVVACSGAIAAAGMAADSLGSLVGSGSFGWRQPIALVAVAAGLSAPVLGLGWAVGSAPHGDLRRDVATPVPAYMIDAMESRGARVLVLQPAGSTVHYRVLAGDGLRLGDESVLPDRATPRLAALVSDVLSESRIDDARRLGALGIRYVVLPAPKAASALYRAAAAQLDALPGLSRTSTDQSALSGWQVAARDVRVPAGAHGGWRVGWLVSEGVAWLVLVVLAAPGARRTPSYPRSERP